MNYRSTRNSALNVTSAHAITKGLSDEGGLYVPESIPQLSKDEILAMCDMSYADRAFEVFSRLLTDFTADEIRHCVDSAYNDKNFDSNNIAELAKLIPGTYVLELWHGPTCAFKDMALQIMPWLLSLSIAKQGGGKDALILVATSGDTGKAALEGYRDVERVRILVFYPTGGVSRIQQKQMATQEGANVGVVAIRGNFDDAQTAVKRVFGSAEMAREADAHGFFFSSANSINWGRLAPQIVYYVSAYCDLLRAGRVRAGEPINVCVPTGNFGNILAAYIAKRMGLPIDRLICASNRNHILTDFFETGVYDRNRDFYTTISPSMDILISSNLERLLFFASGADATRSRMQELAETGRFAVDPALRAALAKDFAAYYLDEDETRAAIRSLYGEYGYLCDPHTAVAAGALRKYRAATGDDRVTVVASTASPYKFAPAVCEALGMGTINDAYACIDALAEKTGLPVPPQLGELRSKPDRFTKVIDRESIADAVRAFLSE